MTSIESNYGILLLLLKKRFEQNMSRHKGIKWEDVKGKLLTNENKLWSLSEMEKTGGEPDVVGFDKKRGEFIFFDCSPETPQGRRNACYDKKAQELREKKGIHPKGNAIDMAATMGVEILDEQEFRSLQKLGEFDIKTSSWLRTPENIRQRGGALFADRRYDHVFVYHNSAPSFYAARGFRGSLRI